MAFTLALLHDSHIMLCFLHILGKLVGHNDIANISKLSKLAQFVVLEL